MPPPSGVPSQTILVVDDDLPVLAMVVKILKAAHFDVLSALSAAQALELAENPKTRIDLLLSDVDMPGMSGPDLGEAMRAKRPDLRIMLMSGMQAGSLLVLNSGWAFIDKPFVPKRLVQMVSDVLVEPNRSQGSKGFDSRNDSTLAPEDLTNDIRKNIEHS